MLPDLEHESPEPNYSIRPVTRQPRAEQFQLTQDIGQSLASTNELENVADALNTAYHLSSAVRTYHERDGDGMGDLGLRVESSAEPTGDEPDALKTPTRPKPLRTGRAITAPPQMTLKTTPSSNTRTGTPVPPDLKKQPSSLSSSGDSFHSFHSPISPPPPSPPYSDPPSPTAKPDERVSLDVPRLRSHTRDTSDVTITGHSELSDLTEAESRQEDTSSSFPLVPRTPPLVSDTASEDHWSEPVTPEPSNELRRREKRLTRRSYSPLPSPVNLYFPGNRLSGHHLTTAILQKTCSLLLGPPVQLVALMLNIAAKITNGIHRGASFGYQEGGEKIPCSWDFSDADEDPEDVWEEDDYGISLGKSIAKETTGSWEID